MLILTIVTASLFTLFIFVSKKKSKDLGIPVYPGKWPILGHIPMFFGDNVKLFDNIAKISMNAIVNGGCTYIKLGPIHNYYFLTDPDDILTILNATTEKNYLYSFGDAWLGNGLMTAPPQLWQFKKKLLYPMFQQQNLNKFLVVFNHQSRRLVGKLSRHIGKGAFDHETDILLTSLETICQAVLGLDFGEEMARNRQCIHAIEELLDILVARLKTVWLHCKPIYEMSSIKKKHDTNLKIVNKLVKELINKRKSELKGTPKKVQGDADFQPFVDTMFKILSENESFTEKDVLDEVNTIIVAGYETNATTLCFCLMVLGHHQDVQDKVYEELQGVFENTDRDIDKYDLSKLVYLEAVIKETLRLFPTIPFIARKVNTDLKIKEYTIPSGTDCFISFYGLGRNPEWGKDALEFNPDRWMSPETLPKNPNFLMQFGAGKRYCPSKTYAMMALKTNLAHVLRNYRIKADMDKLVLQMLILLKPASGHHIILEPRKGENTAN